MPSFGNPQDPAFQRMSRSLDFDRRLAFHDVRQSRAHVAMLADCGIVAADDAAQLRGALDAVEKELANGEFEFREDDEDIHMAVERRVTELAGAAGGRLHTARSRNDQVATDLALYTAERADDAARRARELQAELLALAERHADWPMPGYTHLQRAQPVYLGHHLLAYFWMVERDRVRLERVRHDALARLPLGSGALAGVNFPVDRAQVAAELGFTGVSENSIDAVSNRDYALDYLAAAATCATHLSRLGAELVLWAGDEFGFCTLAPEWTSGSSIMPQKRNPDAAELLRAKAPRVAGHLVALHGVMHGLPLAYSKDLQEDKEHLFDAADTLELCLDAATGMLAGIAFHRDRLAEAAGDEMLAATDVADLLVRRGVPFREAHGIVAGLVRTALERGTTLSSLRPEDLKAHSEHLDDEMTALLRDRSWLDSKVSAGGTGAGPLADQIQAAHRALDGSSR